ncbi:hypothetical protein D0T53_06615 [Dysgonomonas sp. 216]|uniref:hypothetical protein n=1 Tax=Dysgonomonas sp. 216 TaxID=2302934 RepID=UPI0013D282D7|nr:hypothetical protein [Dysgonomonas sp. 216]NDW18587.1 hypothetical protein [Dysgonomonas sp. 216]
MAKRKKKKSQTKITVKDYIKAVKKADRDIQLETQTGWVSTNKIHKSKKVYNRKNYKKDYLNE